MAVCPLFFGILALGFRQQPLVVAFEMLSLTALFVFVFAYLFRQDPFDVASQIMMVVAFRDVVPAVFEQTRAIAASAPQETTMVPSLLLQGALRCHVHRYRLRKLRKERGVQWEIMETACPKMEEKRKSRRHEEMVQRWAKLANLLGLLPESKSAMARLCAQAGTWNTKYQADKAVEKESNNLLNVERTAANELVGKTAAIEDLRKEHGGGNLREIRSARTKAMAAGVKSDHPDMQRNAEELMPIQGRSPARRQMNLRLAFEYSGPGQKLSLLAQLTGTSSTCIDCLDKCSARAYPLGGFRVVVNSTTGTKAFTNDTEFTHNVALDTNRQISLADDGYIITHLRADGGDVITYRLDVEQDLPPKAVRAAKAATWRHTGGTVRTYEWLHWDEKIAQYEASRHIAPTETKSSIDYIDVTSNDQNRRTVAWALRESLAREARIEALCALGRERIRARAAAH